MHPAYSVIFFTTASGAGYGLLALLGVLGPLGLVPSTPVFGFVAMGLALALISAGLLSSTFHLGRPERAWRAVSQWRTSWLSREGVLALATFVPAGVLGIGWVFFGRLGGVVAVAGFLAAALAAATVYATGMIYASLRTIRAWHQPLVVPVYLALGLASGAVLLNLLLVAFGEGRRWAFLLAAGLLAIAWVLKWSYWRTIDEDDRTLTVGAATGLGRFGRVRMLEPPHSRPNFVMREMGYMIARKHALKLRMLAQWLTFGGPVALLLVMAAFMSGLQWFMLPVVMSVAAGVMTERWLFFAEAEHVVMLYYGREAA